MKNTNPLKAVTKMVLAQRKLNDHRSEETKLIDDIQHLACKALNDQGRGKSLVSKVQVDEQTFAVMICDRGKTPKGRPGRPMRRYQTEIKRVQSSE